MLDLPGGMRISTIHAFCQSLLRRFPLEAALAPHFRLLEDADGHAELQRLAREDAMAAADPAALATIAGLVSDLGFGRLVAELAAQGGRSCARCCSAARPGAAGAAATRARASMADDAGLVRAGVEWPDGTSCATCVAQLKASGSATEIRPLATRHGSPGSA